MVGLGHHPWRRQQKSRHVEVYLKFITAFIEAVQSFSVLFTLRPRAEEVFISTQNLTQHVEKKLMDECPGLLISAHRGVRSFRLELRRFTGFLLRSVKLYIVVYCMSSFLVLDMGLSSTR